MSTTTKPFMENKSKTGPCDYAGYGLFRLSPRRVRIDGEIVHCFAFGPAPEAKPNG